VKDVGAKVTAKVYKHEIKIMRKYTWNACSPTITCVSG